MGHERVTPVPSPVPRSFSEGCSEGGSGVENKGSLESTQNFSESPLSCYNALLLHLVPNRGQTLTHSIQMCPTPVDSLARGTLEKAALCLVDVLRNALLRVLLRNRHNRVVTFKTPCERISAKVDAG